MPTALIRTDLETLLRAAAPEPRRTPEPPTRSFGGDLQSLLCGVDAPALKPREKSVDDRR